MRITLEEACESIADGDHQAPPKSDEGIPFITISCLDPDGGRPGYSAATKVPVAYYESLSDNRRAKCGDVLLSVVGSLGIPYLVKEDDRFVFQRHIAILRPGRHLVPEYLYYLLRSPALFHYIDSIAQGAAQRTLTLTQLRSMEIELPPLETQRCIASILMAYDNLIANNRKQIALLEEAAQRLYKEWFIDLRFPGHEDVEDVDGQPQGWEMVPISEYADIVKGCSYKSENIDVAEGVPMVNLSSIAAWGGYKPYTERTYGGVYKSEQVLKANDVVMALTEQTAGLAGYVARIPHYAEGAVPSMDLACLRPKNGCTAYLYGACRYGNVSRSLSPLANGTKIKHLKPEALGYTKLLVPPVELQGEFDCVCNPLFRDIDALMEMNGSLQAARDRLLPKLMSGEIEV